MANRTIGSQSEQLSWTKFMIVLYRFPVSLMLLFCFQPGKWTPVMYSFSIYICYFKRLRMYNWKEFFVTIILYNLPTCSSSSCDSNLTNKQKKWHNHLAVHSQPVFTFQAAMKTWKNGINKKFPQKIFRSCAHFEHPGDRQTLIYWMATDKSH